MITTNAPAPPVRERPSAQLERLCREASPATLAVFVARCRWQIRQSGSPSLAAAYAIAAGVARERGVA